MNSVTTSGSDLLLHDENYDEQSKPEVLRVSSKDIQGSGWGGELEQIAASCEVDSKVHGKFLGLPSLLSVVEREGVYFHSVIDEGSFVSAIHVRNTESID